MTFEIDIPQNPRIIRELGTYPLKLDIVSPRGTAVNRRIARLGLAGYEPDTQATLLTLLRHRSKAMVFYDIGAHIGLYSALASSIYRRQGINCFAFEPTPKTSDKAVRLRNVNRLNYSVVKLAASSSAGEVDFYLSTKAETSNSLNADFRPGSPAIRVRMETIDSFVLQGAPAPTVIKIDVETHEPEVIKGAVTVIEKYRPYIVCELLPSGNLQRMREAVTALEALNYIFYHVSNAESFRPCDSAQVLGSTDVKYRDWLFAPKLLNERFNQRLGEWRRAIAACQAPATEERVIAPSQVELDSGR